MATEHDGLTDVPAQESLVGARDPVTGMVLILPLLLVYQAGLLLTDFQGGLNGVDFLTAVVVSYGSREALLALDGALVCLFAVLLIVQRRRGLLDTQTFLLVAAEGTAYAMCLGAVVIWILKQGHVIAVGGLIGDVTRSAGAGVHEEIIFRLGLFNLLTYASRVGFGTRPWMSVVVGLVTSSLVFSAAHHVGREGEAWTLAAFAYRAVAGAILGVIYRARGLAVAAYTHAIYDLLVFLG